MARKTRGKTPRVLRFAQALALTSGVGSAAAGCYLAHESPPRLDGGRTPDASLRADAGADASRRLDTGLDAPLGRDTGVVVTCETCFCGFGEETDAGPSCEALGLLDCCLLGGPCAPPDLPA